MGSLNILAGDFLARRSSYRFGAFQLIAPTGNRFFSRSRQEKIPASGMIELEVKNEQSTRGFGGSAVKGIVGGVLLGPIGAGAGLLTGGRGTKVMFSVTFSDGRHLFAVTDGKTFHAIQAAYMTAKWNRENGATQVRVKQGEGISGCLWTIFFSLLLVLLIIILFNVLR